MHHDESNAIISSAPRTGSTPSLVYASSLTEDVFYIFGNTGDNISNIKLLRLPTVPDYRGSLTFIEGNRHVPFDIARVYYLYDIPHTATRGGHAHKELHQLIIAVSGSFDVFIDNGREQRTVRLDKPNVGLLLCSKTWRELENFSSGSVCVVLASIPYEESDYYRDYRDFIRSLK